MDEEREVDGAGSAVSDLMDRTRQRHLEHGIERVETMVAEAHQKNRDEAKARAKKGMDPLPLDLPRASSVNWVKKAAAKLDVAPSWFKDDDLLAVYKDYVNDALYVLRKLPEFATFATHRIEIRWTSRAIIRRDLIIDEPRCGRTKVVTEAERETWRGDGMAPSFRLELSLPWFMLASEREADRGLHDLLMYCGLRDGRPAMRKPDIAAHAATLGRYGIEGFREAHAFAHAQYHPNHERVLREHGFDPLTGQGLLWKPDRQEPVSRSKVRVLRGKDAAAEQASSLED